MINDTEELANILSRLKSVGSTTRTSSVDSILLSTDEIHILDPKLLSLDKILAKYS